MKKIFSSVACLLVAATLFSSCVAKRKYLEARNRADKEHSHNMELESALAAKRDSINQLSGQVGALGDVYQSTSNELNMSKEQIAEQQKHLMQLQSMIDQQRKNTERLRQAIADALTGFNTNELTVTMKNGKVYVSMQESLLFPSGSAVVNPKGKDALAKLAGVLNTNLNINVDVEGHTDTVDIHNKMYADNWALSVARATSIARILIGDYGVNPSRLIASGRSQYDPVASNETPDGRAQNRRTEIILEPKLDELMDAIGSGSTGQK